MIELGDKVKISSEGFVGFAYVRSFAGQGAWVSVERSGHEFFVLMRAISSLRV